MCALSVFCTHGSRGGVLVAEDATDLTHRRQQQVAPPTAAAAPSKNGRTASMQPVSQPQHSRRSGAGSRLRIRSSRSPAEVASDEHDVPEDDSSVEDDAEDEEDEDEDDEHLLLRVRLRLRDAGARVRSSVDDMKMAPAITTNKWRMESASSSRCSSTGRPPGMNERWRPIPAVSTMIVSWRRTTRGARGCRCGRPLSVTSSPVRYAVAIGAERSSVKRWRRGAILPTPLKAKMNLRGVISRAPARPCLVDDSHVSDAGRVAATAQPAASFDVAFKRSPIRRCTRRSRRRPASSRRSRSALASTAPPGAQDLVVQVHTAEQRDAHNRPLPGGLYDPAMDPTDQYESCKTCGLDYTTCRGHLGHIELSCRRPRRCSSRSSSLLRSTCLLCHRLKADAGKLRILADALRLLDAGLLVDATVLMEGRAATGGGAAAAAATTTSTSTATTAAATTRARAGATGARCAADRSPTRRGACSGAAATAAAGGRRCGRRCRHGLRCGGGCTTRSSGRCCTARSARAAAARPARSRARRAQDLLPGAAPVRRRRRRCCPPATATATATTPARTLAAATPTMTTATTATATAPTPPPMAAVTAQRAPPAAARLPHPPPRPLLPRRARRRRRRRRQGAQVHDDVGAGRHISKLWRQEGDLLRIIFPHLSASAFFLHVLAVPPSRFRPPSKVGDDVFEHAQNVWLGRCSPPTSSCYSCSRNPPPRMAATARRRPTSRRKERVLGVGRAQPRSRVRHRRDQVGCTGVGGGVEPPGVKQTLERKEGLFRKRQWGSASTSPRDR